MAQRFANILRRVFALVLLALVASTSFVAEADQLAPLPDKLMPDDSRDEFSLVLLPDTQMYADHYPRILWSQIQWIRDHACEMNVKFVMHLGDIVDDDRSDEWMTVDGAFRLLDGRVPYLVVPGNHDYPNPLQDMGIKSASNFNAIFSPYRFKGRPWYGGQYGVSAENSFAFFSAAGLKFLVLGLEFGPPDDVLEWAERVVQEHKDEHHVILVTHAYMYRDNTRLGEGDQHNPHGDDPRANDGEQIWDKLVRRNENVDFVFSGHVPGAGFLISETDRGHPVIQMLADYQTEEFGGRGWLRVLKVRPLDRQIDVFTYSPWLKRFREEVDQQFTIDVPWMFNSPLDGG